jgi:dynein heavy chain
LFEQHKLLLSLQMCVRILKSADSLNDTEWRFFLRGGAVLDRSDQPTNPAPGWISELAWDNVVELEQQVPHFLGVRVAFPKSRHAVEARVWVTVPPEYSSLFADCPPVITHTGRHGPD